MPKSCVLRSWRAQASAILIVVTVGLPLPAIEAAVAAPVQIAPPVGETNSTVPAGVFTNDVYFTNTVPFTFDEGYVILSTCPDGTCPIVADDGLKLLVLETGLEIPFNSYTHDLPSADVTALFQPGSNTVRVELVDLMGPVRSSSHPFYLVRSATAPPQSVLRIEPVPTGTESIWTAYTASTRDPVNTLTGSFGYQFTDATIPGRGPTIEFTRSYNSNDTRVSSVGAGWTHSYNIHLANPGDGSGEVVLVGPQGRSDRYRTSGATEFIPPPGVHTGLTKSLDGTYTATHKDQSTWVFDARGNLIRIGDRYGNLSRLRYEAERLVAVGDPAGRGEITLRYDDVRDRLVEVRDWIGRVVKYGYDPVNRLAQVTDREGNATVYAYDGTSHRLVSITDARGNKAVTNTYDGDGRVKTQKDARGLLTGGVTTLAYATAPDGTKTTTVDYPPASFESGWQPQVFDSYDSRGRLVARTSKPTSNATEWATEQYGYNETFDLTTVTDPDGNTTTLCYDVDYAGAPILSSRGNLTRRILPAPEPTTKRPVWLSRYDDRNNLVQTFSARGVSTPAGVSCSTDLRGQLNMIFATDYAYDADSRTRLESVREHVTEPEAGPLDAITKFEYGDPTNAGRVTRVIPPRGNAGAVPDYSFATTYVYFSQGSKAGMLDRATDPLGGSTTYDYDPVGRQIGLVDPIGNAAAATPADHTWSSSYDKEDQLRFTGAPGPASGDARIVTEFRYDSVGNCEVVVDPNGQLTRYGFDERDDLARVLQSPTAADPDTEPQVRITTAYEYDDHGNIRRVIRAKGHPTDERVTDYRYDGLDRLRAELQYPAWPAATPVLQTAYSFDRRSNRVGLIDPLGQLTAFGYDALNRLISTSFSDGTTPGVGYSYDVDNNRIGMTDGTGASSYIYDELGRLISVASPGDDGQNIVAYRYDRDGNRRSMTYPDGSELSYQHDKGGRLTTIEDWLSRKTTYDFSADGLVVGSTNINGTTTKNIYDNVRRLTDVSNLSGSNVISQHRYTLDAVGNRLSLDEILPENGTPHPPDGKRKASTAYKYDRLYRLTSEQSDEVAAAYLYDSVGNRLKRTDDGDVVSYTYDRADRIDAVATTKNKQTSTVDYTMNANGNLIGRSHDVFQYDQANRLIYSKSQGQVHSVYDGDGKRVKTDVSQGAMVTHVYDVNTELPLLLSDGRRKYVWGLGLEYAVDGNGELEAYHVDGLGSVRAVSLANGNVVQNYRTDAFGVVVGTHGSHNQPFQFAGEERDKESEFYNLRARAYDPAVGRFIQRDSLGGLTSDPASVHRYTYATNNPVNMTDPSGEWVQVAAAIVVVGGFYLFDAAREVGDPRDDLETTSEYQQRVAVAAGRELTLELLGQAVAARVVRFIHPGSFGRPPTTFGKTLFGVRTQYDILKERISADVEALIEQSWWALASWRNEDFIDGPACRLDPRSTAPIASSCSSSRVKRG